jgi:hypothetical protein
MVRFTGHVEVQVSSMQACPAAHAAPHAPHWPKTLSDAQRSVHSVSSAEHPVVHAPCWQVSVAAQAVPQAPQL